MQPTFFIRNSSGLKYFHNPTHEVKTKLTEVTLRIYFQGSGNTIVALDMLVFEPGTCLN